VKSSSPDEVLSDFGNPKARVSTWDAGIDAAYNDRIFLSPPVNGWVLVVSTSFFEPTEATLDRLRALSTRFGEAQFFCTHRVPEAHAWALARGGEIARAFYHIGEAGETIWNTGSPTVPENGIDFSFPTEEDVMGVAGSWSVDPTTLSEADEPGTGRLIES
jgi:hypothetical protein